MTLPRAGSTGTLRQTGMSLTMSRPAVRGKMTNIPPGYGLMKKLLGQGAGYHDCVQQYPALRRSCREVCPGRNLA